MILSEFKIFKGNKSHRIGANEFIVIEERHINALKKHMLAPHIIPSRIHKEANEALSYYPELQKVSIEFRFKKNIRKSFMQAQPLFPTLVRNKKHRKYLILISNKMEIEGHTFSIDDMDSEVLIGWLGHELGHIVDYQRHSNVGIVFFGFRYLLQQPFLKKAERTADRFAIEHGMYDYIMATKNYILQNTDLSPKYKKRIKRLYMSPEKIVQMVNTMDQEEVIEEVSKELREHD